MGTTPVSGHEAVEAILALAEDDAAAFVRSRIASKEMSRVMIALNREILSADPKRRSRAELAIRRIGFDGRP